MKDIQKAIDNAVASIEMEGFQVSEETKEMCRRYLSGEITFDEYMDYSLRKAGVKKDDKEDK